mmetsp:Transcript_18767/g.23061  ORF Transcript_18767/g.23061 Transcript_18767/m.23061 type:complete len:270 (-) Transcript_18767:854-1663(-)
MSLSFWSWCIASMSRCCKVVGLSALSLVFEGRCGGEYIRSCALSSSGTSSSRVCLAATAIVSRYGYLTSNLEHNPLSIFVTRPKKISSAGHASTGFLRFCFCFVSIASSFSSSSISFSIASFRFSNLSDLSFFASFTSLCGVVLPNDLRIDAISSNGSFRFSTSPISSKLVRSASRSFSSDACISLANATFIPGERRLVSPKSSSTGTEASLSFVLVETRMFPGWGSALKIPPTCICTAHDSTILRSSSSRSTPYSSSRSTSRTANPSQ